MDNTPTTETYPDIKLLGLMLGLDVLSKTLLTDISKSKNDIIVIGDLLYHAGCI